MALVKWRHARRALAMLALVGLAATVAHVVIPSQSPSRPNLTIHLVNPKRVTTDPVVVRVCGETQKGHRRNPVSEGAGSWCGLTGFRWPRCTQPPAVIPVHRGHHLLTVEVNSRYHQQNQPPLSVNRRIRVTGPRLGQRAPGCLR